MDAVIIGIDVSKDRLDVAVRPDGEVFAVNRTGGGIDELIERLKSRLVKLVAIEATGGFETVVAAGLAGAGLPGVVSIRHRCGPSPKPSASGPRLIRSTRR
jgi:transposase